MYPLRETGHDDMIEIISLSSSLEGALGFPRYRYHGSSVGASRTVRVVTGPCGGG